MTLYQLPPAAVDVIAQIAPGSHARGTLHGVSRPTDARAGRGCFA